MNGYIWLAEEWDYNYLAARRERNISPTWASIVVRMQR